jgi:hypothetical protein
VGRDGPGGQEQPVGDLAVGSSLAGITISRCCGVSSASALSTAGAACTVTPLARSSAPARRAHGAAPRRRNVSSATASRFFASLIRRCLRSHSP